MIVSDAGCRMQAGRVTARLKLVTRNAAFLATRILPPTGVTEHENVAILVIVRVKRERGDTTPHVEKQIFLRGWVVG
jgi:hypothetical protein